MDEKEQLITYRQLRIKMLEALENYTYPFASAKMGLHEFLDFARDIRILELDAASGVFDENERHALHELITIAEKTWKELKQCKLNLHSFEFDEIESELSLCAKRTLTVFESRGRLSSVVCEQGLKL